MTRPDVSRRADAWRPRWRPLWVAAAVVPFVLCACAPPEPPAAPKAATSSGIPVSPTTGTSVAPGTRFVCPACGLACDQAVYDRPGTCPHCGMTLIAESERTAPRRVGIVVFDGAEIIDFTGPWEVFMIAGFEVYTVAAKRDPVVTTGGMKLVPDYTFADAPIPEVILVPGGGVDAASHDPAVLGWIEQTTRRAKTTMSVCNGAFILANAGLLDGLTATTTYGYLDTLRASFPKVTVVRDQRYVDNGSVITTAGLSAGIDGALHVVDKLLGRSKAQRVALALEYDWRPEGGFVRGALADHVLPKDLVRAPGREYAVERTEGNTERWDEELSATGVASPVMLDAIGACFTRAGWAADRAPGSAGSWRLDASPGERWIATATLKGGSGGSSASRVQLHVERAR